MADFVKIARTADVGPGTARVYEVNGKRIALCNAEGEFFAIDDLCTHDGGPLGEGQLLGHVIECPRHGARFDVRTGKVLALPAVRPVGTYEVRVEGEDVLVAVP